MADNIIALIITTMSFLCFAGGFFSGRSVEQRYWQKLAIEHNAGQFIVVDKTTGATKFVWNDEIEVEDN